MSVIALKLDRQLSTMDAVTAQRVERLVRDALTLAKPADAANGWPVGYFEETARACRG